MAYLKDLLSPYYRRMNSDWIKYRDVLRSGTYFRDKYLEQYSTRESTTDFNTRKSISYTPAIARACISKFRNAIFQRMADITRTGGDKPYQVAIQGTDTYGVDNAGRSMNQFIGQEVLMDLLAMGQVGIFIDRAILPEGTSQADMHDTRPYMYLYATEDILNMETEGNVLTKVLLRRNDHKVDDTLGLYIEDTEEYIYMEKTPDGVIYRVYEADTEENVEEILLDLPEIPFVLLKLDQSLLKDIADYQIALLNIESGDVNFCFKANFPFYTEQQDLTTKQYGKMLTSFDDDGNETTTTTDDPAHVKTGVSSGRLYGTNMDRPGFIHPSPEPLMASIAKQKQMKEAIEYLIGLNLSSLASSSAETKKNDTALKEEGLSVIGLELERAERKIAEIWSQYMGSEVAQIDYPNNYSLRTDEDRRNEAHEIIEEAKKIPSVEYQKEAAKRAARLIMAQGISKSKWDKIDLEIENAILVFVDPEDIRKDKEAGLVSTETASERIRHYPIGEAVKAKEEKTEQLRQIAQAQSSNPNNLDARVGGGDGAKDEKTLSQDPVMSTTGKKVRGEAE